MVINMLLKVYITAAFPVFYALISCYYFEIYYHEIGHYVFIRIWERVMGYRRGEINIYFFSNAPAITESDFYIKLTVDERKRRVLTAVRANALAGFIMMLLNGIVYATIWTIPLFIIFMETNMNWVIPIPGIASFIVHTFFALSLFSGKKNSKNSDRYFFKNPDKFLKYVTEDER